MNYKGIKCIFILHFNLGVLEKLQEAKLERGNYFCNELKEKCSFCKSCSTLTTILGLQFSHEVNLAR